MFRRVPSGELDETVGHHGADIAVVAVPRHAAQEVVSLAVNAGIRAVLNFASGTVRVPHGVRLKNVDLSVSLESLSFFLAQEDAGGPEDA